MTSPARFDRNHGKGAFVRLRSMLEDPAMNCYSYANG